MDCRLLDERLDHLLDGSCTPEAWALATRHAAGCARCRRVLDAVTGGLDDQDAAARSALTAAILARTSGAACASAHDRLCGCVDGTVAPADRELVSSHLEGCANCRALASAIAETAAVLPTFASLEPDAGFVTRVVARTARLVPEPGLVAHAVGWWRRAVTRPRFALEVAYVLTLVLMIVVGNPVAAFRDTSSRAVALARPGVERAVSTVVDPVAVAGSGGLDRVRSAVASMAGRGSTAAQATRVESTSLFRRWFTAVFGGSLNAWLDRIWRATAAIRQAWNGLWAAGAAGGANRESASRPGSLPAQTEPGGGPAR